MKPMIAKYPGRCARTGAPIRPGDAILWARGHTELATDLDPELAATDPDAAQAAGAYVARAMRRSVSNHYRTGSTELYRNKRGRCEDAPCCGCCNF